MKSAKINHKISLDRKIFQYLLFTTFFSLALLGFFWFESVVKNFQKDVKILKATYSENKKAETKSKILEIKDWIYWVRSHPPGSVLNDLQVINNKSEIYLKDLEGQLQRYCLDSLSKVRYAKDEYVFINTYEGKALISNGKINDPPFDIFMTGDSSWIKIFKIEQLSKGRSAGFFYTYPFKKISEPKTSLKTSFFSFLPELNWIIGTGFYEDDVYSIIELKRKELNSSLRQSVLRVAPFLLLTIILSYLIVLFFSRRLARNLAIFRNFFKTNAGNYNVIDKSQVTYREFEDLAESANLMSAANRKAEEELKHHRDHLEELVIQRTAELEKEKEHALSADRLKSAFLATMSHELRTPLNSIIGFTGILMQERPGPLNSEQKKQIGMAQNSSRHLLSLINDVLDISKIEAGQLKMNYSEFSLPEVIEKVVETNRPFADKKNLGINISIDEKINFITSDSIRVQQILLNLVNNAIKFTDVGAISINCNHSDDNVEIKITDSGIGIKNEKIEQLFKPFMQIDTGLTRKHEGTGLGLSICKKLTEMLGGKIEVDSEFGKGSTFSVTLPVNKIQIYEEKDPDN